MCVNASKSHLQMSKMYPFKLSKQIFDQCSYLSPGTCTKCLFLLQRQYHKPVDIFQSRHLCKYVQCSGKEQNKRTCVNKYSAKLINVRRLLSHSRSSSDTSCDETKQSEDRKSNTVAQESQNSSPGHPIPCDDPDKCTLEPLENNTPVIESQASGDGNFMCTEDLDPNISPSLSVLTNSTTVNAPQSAVSLSQAVLPGKGPPPEPPVTCCMSGCANCVWIAYAEELRDYYADGGQAARKALEQIEDPSLRAFVKLELGL